jgi:general secretion pathway protein D
MMIKNNMKIKKKLIWATAFLLWTSAFLPAQSIAEKKANLKGTESDLDRETDQFLFQVNQEVQDLHAQIQRMYEDAFRLYTEQASPDEYKYLLDKINENKRYLHHLEQSWRETAAKGNRTEGYGLWHAPETTLEQLIIDYGSQDFVYLIPPEVGSIKISIASNLPVPRAYWNGMLEHILSQNGVGIKTLNPYLKQLFLIKNNNAHLKLITNNRTDLETLPGNARISFVLSPEPSEVRRTHLFLEKFVNPNTTILQTLGRDILLVGQCSDIQDLLRLCDFITINRGDKEYRLIPVYKVRAEEIVKILAAMFDQGTGEEPVQVEGAGSSNKGPILPRRLHESNGLRVVVLNNNSQGLFIVGTKEEIKKAEEIICSVENQIGGGRERTIFWYNVKHSEPDELADVLYRIYQLMMVTGAGADSSSMAANSSNEGVVVRSSNGQSSDIQGPGPNLGYQETGPAGGTLVNPAPAQPGQIVQTNPNKGRDNFIVDLKTGSIVMVVEADILPKLKDLLRKLDVPKKMVQIETLLFEKVLTRENNFGLNLLRIGDLANNDHFTGAAFNTICPCISDFIPTARGVFDFFLSRKKTDSGIPAFDLAYRFLLSQDDVQINSSPSILTINQTPATIAINEDISINTGGNPIQTAGGGLAYQDTFTRAQYGTTISIKPTIHLYDEDCIDEEGYDYVTLETDITFDTIHPGGNPDRPDVTRRHITNQVQVVDGETVILGNLRRKITTDSKDSIPFLGELPGIGKLFSETCTKDSTTEMFIFITPRIVKDPKEELAAIRQDLLCRRPGDLPYFLECVEEAHRFEKTRLMAGSLELLLGHSPARYYVIEGEYDGR